MCTLDKQEVQGNAYAVFFMRTTPIFPTNKFTKCILKQQNVSETALNSQAS